MNLAPIGQTCFNKMLWKKEIKRVPRTFTIPTMFLAFNRIFHHLTHLPMLSVKRFVFLKRKIHSISHIPYIFQAETGTWTDCSPTHYKTHNNTHIFKRYK